MLKKLFALFITASLMLPMVAAADAVKGRINYISKKAGTIQLTPKGKEPVVVRVDDSTVFEEAKNLKDLGTKDLIRVEFEPGKPATKVTKIVFGIPKEKEVSVKEMDAFMKGDWSCRTPEGKEVDMAQVEEGMRKCVLVDARPKKRFVAGHIPTAISIFAKDLPDNLDKLPEDKDTQIIFYCGGPTCPFTGQSIEVAEDAGYTNVKGFQAGMPAWKKAGKPVHATAGWVAKNLDENHVVIDTRPKEVSSKLHVKSAVAMPAQEFLDLTRHLIKTRTPAKLPGVADKGAPIILYSDSHDSEDVLTAYGELKKYRYKNVAILEGGFEGWLTAGHPTASGPAKEEITYVRKLKKGAVPPKEFAKLEESRDDVVFVDVRTAKEASAGVLDGAVQMPLDAIDDKAATLPRDKEIITYCSNGIRSEMAYEALKSKGFDNVRFLNETIDVKADGSWSFVN